jgi:hypothetical protein
MNNDSKNQIIEKLKSATNILVTVSADPTIDQLSACIATTLLLNKFKKNATAVFSGKVPTFLSFLKPKENIEKNVDSLRDFIIALDKSKADKLRYKVEDDVVKIFITPYRTSITEKDLKYSAGDFNVELILALGVHHQQDLDRAITAHGRIFHDAVVMSINNSPGGDFGVANWEDLDASSLSEQIANLAGELDPSLLDAETATALLTGIVAETSRFSNDKTRPQTMNVSSQLLQAGADQQLVNTQLQDLIGTVVNLDAGSEIRPTTKTARTDRSPAHNDVDDELLIDDQGSTNPTDESSTNSTVVAPDLTLPNIASDEQSTNQSAPISPSVEDMLGMPVESTPTPMLDTNPTPAAMAVPDTAASAIITGQVPAENADNARQAVEDAWGAGPTDDTAATAEQSFAGLPIPDPVDVPTEPVIQPILPNQPSYANPATTTEYTIPTVPEYEPAPLGMSPADQAFTMPMPPTSSISASPVIVQLPTDGQPPAGSTLPPPLPPPMTPPSFGGLGR